MNKNKNKKFPVFHDYYNNNDDYKPTKKGGYVRAEKKVLHQPIIFSNESLTTEDLKKKSLETE
jgi:hypothetical protein